MRKKSTDMQIKTVSFKLIPGFMFINLILILLKASGWIGMSWFAVFSPILLLFGIVLTILAVGGVILYMFMAASRKIVK